MIGGATRGTGGRALARHLANEAKNDQVVPGPSRGLLSDPADAYALQRELERIQAHVRTRRPIHHVHCDPPVGLAAERSAEVQAAYWKAYEREFGLGRAPFYSRIHVKGGREHEHRVYGLGRPDGSVVDLSFDFARREKVARLVEFEFGLPWTPGKHNRAVIAAFEREGRPEIATAMQVSGLDTMTRPVAPLTPRERAQQERTAVRKADVAAAAFAAWKATGTGADFAAALRAAGLDLRQGDKAPVIVDFSGSVHRAAQLVSTGAKAAGEESIRAKNFRERLEGMDLAAYVPGEIPTGPVIAPSPILALADKEKQHGYDSHAPSSVVGGGHSRDPGRDGRGRRGGRAPADPGPQGPDPGRFRGLARGSDGRLAYAVARFAGAAEQVGEVETRLGARPAGGDRERPDRIGATHGRARVDDRRAERGLANCLANRDREARLRALTRRLAPHPPPPPMRRAVVLCPGLETEDEIRDRRAGWIAATMTRGYSRAWLPRSVADRIRHVRVWPEQGMVILTLHSGTRIFDSQDRIDVEGQIDDITVDELVSAVRRREWDTVEVHGGPGFRRAVAMQLALLEPPVAVADANSILSAADQEEIERKRRARLPMPIATPAREPTAGPKVR